MPPRSRSSWQLSRSGDRGRASLDGPAAPQGASRASRPTADWRRIRSSPRRLRGGSQAPPVRQRRRQLGISAGELVTSQYAGDASRIWSDTPPAARLRARLDAFPGIGQKKAAMAVEILERDLGVELTDLARSDIAYDIPAPRLPPYGHREGR